jgi:hypothetical protein
MPQREAELEQEMPVRLLLVGIHGRHGCDANVTDTLVSIEP